MPQRPLSELRPQKFPRIGDEEFAFDSYNEDTNEETSEPDDHSDAGEEIPLLENEQRCKVACCTIL